jgi:hypothetical protein
MLQG